MTDGVHAHQFFENEERLMMEREAGAVLHCSVADKGVGTVFDTPTGEPTWEGGESWMPAS